MSANPASANDGNATANTNTNNANAGGGSGGGPNAAGTAATGGGGGGNAGGAGGGGATATSSGNSRFTPQQHNAQTPGSGATGGNQATASPSSGTAPNNQNLNQIVSRSCPLRSLLTAHPLHTVHPLPIYCPTAPVGSRVTVHPYTRTITVPPTFITFISTSTLYTSLVTFDVIQPL